MDFLDRSGCFLCFLCVSHLLFEVEWTGRGRFREVYMFQHGTVSYYDMAWRDAMQSRTSRRF